MNFRKSASPPEPNWASEPLTSGTLMTPCVVAVALIVEPILVSHRRRAIVESLRRHALADKLDKENS